MECLCNDCYHQVYGNSYGQRQDNRKEIVRKEVYHLVEYERDVSTCQAVTNCQDFNCNACQAMRAKIYDYENGYY